MNKMLVTQSLKPIHSSKPDTIKTEQKEIFFSSSRSSRRDPMNSGQPPLRLWRHLLATT